MTEVSSIDVKIIGESMLPELPHEYYEEFYVAKPGPFSMIADEKESYFVIFKITRKDSVTPVYIIHDVISKDTLGDLIKHPPKLNIRFDELRKDISQINMNIRNKKYVMDNLMSGAYGSYPVFTTISPDKLKALHSLNNCKTDHPERILNKFFANKTDWISYEYSEFSLSRLYDELEDISDEKREVKNEEN